METDWHMINCTFKTGRKAEDSDLFSIHFFQRDFLRYHNRRVTAHARAQILATSSARAEFLTDWKTAFNV